MKKIQFISLAALAILLLGSCAQINERIEDLENRIKGVESEQIAPIDQQISNIQTSISDLGAIRSNIQTMASTLSSQGGNITDLTAADESLARRIDELINYVDEELTKYATQDWVCATYSTLEQYYETCDTIAKIDARIGELDFNLSNSIKNCADSLKRWVNEQFEAYYTAAQMDAKLDMMLAAIDSSKTVSDAKVDSIAIEVAKTKVAIDSSKAQITREYTASIKTAIEESEGKLTSALQSAIATVNSNIYSLATTVIHLETAFASLSYRVDTLEKMIYAVSIVPAYYDGSVRAVNGKLSLNLIVSPSTAVGSLTKDNVKLLINTVLTKSVSIDTVGIADDADIIIDKEKGTVEILADIKTRIDALTEGNALSVAANLKNSISYFTTDFVLVQNVPGHKVTFNHNYGESPITRDTCVIKGDKIIKPADPSRAGYFFEKWVTKRNKGADTVDWNFETMTVTCDTTLFATWTQGRTVTFYKKAGTAYKDTLVRPNTKVEKPADPDSTGYAFDGWFKEAACTNLWNFNDNVNADMSLYAKWAKKMTIAELVATNSEFPTTASSTAYPDNAWINAHKDLCYYNLATNALVILDTIQKPVLSYSWNFNQELIKQANGNYRCADDTRTLEFVMAADRDSVISVIVGGSISTNKGTYQPQPKVPDGAIPGIFSVSATKKVYFSKGNLQATYHTGESSYTWSFAAKQYNFIGNAAGNTTIDSQTDNAVVDLFGWTGSDKYSDGIKQYGINTATKNNQYASNDQCCDWGSTIDSNGSWTTLSSAEWIYVVGRSGKSKANVSVNGVTGLVIAPDDFAGTISDSYTAEAWATAETQSGLVFLPAAKQRSGSGVSNGGKYWSGTPKNGNSANALNVENATIVENNYYLGNSVRLVYVIK